MSMHSPRFHHFTADMDTTMDNQDIPSSPTVHDLAPELPCSIPKQPPSLGETQPPLALTGEHGRPRSNSQPESRVGFSPQGGVRPQEGLDEFDNSQYRSTPRHLNSNSRNRAHEEWDDEYWTAPPWDTHDRYWRDDGRSRRKPSRHGPWSRPPPALLNHHPSGPGPTSISGSGSGPLPGPTQSAFSSAYSDEDPDDAVKSHPHEYEPRNNTGKLSVDGLRVRAHRWPDEEMGYIPEHHSLRGGGGFSSMDTAASRAAGRSDVKGLAGKHHQHHQRLDWNDLSPEERAVVMRLPWVQWMNSDIKNHFVAWLGELIGTTMFLFFAFAGTEVANIQSSSQDQNTTTGGSNGFDLSVLLYVSLSFGFSLMVNVWIFFRISGGLFNPAVTLGMLLVGAVPPLRAASLGLAQIGGALLASVVVRYLFPESFNVRTTLGGGASIVQGVFIEALLTAELVFTIFMLAKEKHRATFIAPVGIGLALFIAELVGVQFTGGSLNPARSFGPCVITGKFDQEHWIYWVGPFIGTLIAVGFYRLIKILEYEMANPGADGDDENDPTKNPEKRAEVQSNRPPSIAG